MAGTRVSLAHPLPKLRTGLALAALLLLSACGGGGGGGGGDDEGGGGSLADPIAKAGTDITVAYDASVTLDGTQSSDPEGGALSYLWTQTGGPSVALSNPTSAQPTFTAPSVATTLSFSLAVTAGGRTSTADTVSVTVLAVGFGPATVIDTPAGRAQINQLRTAQDRSGGTAIALYVAEGYSPDSAGDAARHLYATRYDGSVWGTPELVDAGTPGTDIVPGGVAHLGAGRYLAGWIETSGLWSFEVKARFYEPGSGWGAVQTVLDYTPGLPYDYTNPEQLYVGADAATGNAFFVWSDLFDGNAFLDYRNGSWNANFRGIAGDSVSSFDCDGSRCVLLTEDGLSIWAVRYTQSDGLLNTEQLESSVLMFGQAQVAANDLGIHAVWSRFTGSDSRIVYRRLNPGSTTWSAEEILAISTATHTLGGAPKLAAAGAGELKVFYTRAPNTTSDSTLYAVTRDAGVWSAEETVRSYPPATSDISLRAGYLDDSSVQIAFATGAGFSAMRHDGGSWSTETPIHTYRASPGAQYGTYLLGMPSGKALFVVDDAYQPTGNETDAAGMWAGSAELPMTGLDGGSGYVEVASAPDGSALALWIQWELTDPAVYASYRPQAGAWSTPQRLSPPDDSAWALGVHYVGGGLYAGVWKAKSGGDTYAALHAATFDTTSESWGSVASVGESGIEDWLGSASDGAGRVMAAWYLVKTGEPTLRAAVYDAAAEAWGTATQVNDVSVTVRGAAVASDQADRFMVVWQEATSTPGTLRARSYAAGTWDATIADVDTASQFGNDDTPAALASAAAGEYMACWIGHLELEASDPNDYETGQIRCARQSAGTWSAVETVQSLSRPLLGNTYGGPALIAAGTDYALAWRGCADSNPTRWYGAGYAGAAWSAPVTLFDGPVGNICDDETYTAPAVARDGAGNLLAAWSTYESLTRTSAFAAYYDAAGAQWTQGQAIESTPGNTLTVRSTPLTAGGFDLFWIQDEGTRYAVHAGQTQ
jgi:hypothetical protein